MQCRTKLKKIPALMSERISVPVPLFHTQFLTSSPAVDRIGASITALWGQDDARGPISLVPLRWLLEPAAAETGPWWGSQAGTSRLKSQIPVLPFPSPGTRGVTPGRATPPPLLPSCSFIKWIRSFVLDDFPHSVLDDCIFMVSFHIFLYSQVFLIKW